MAVAIDLSLQQQARMLIPISLYFHNDEPDPRSLTKTTMLTYKDTYKSYINKQEHYIKLHTDAGDTTEAKRAKTFFVDSVVGNYNKLESFLNLLHKDLANGNRVKLLIKGFASPLHTGEYNYTLSQRRISSFINQLKQIDTSLVIMNGMANGNLVVEEVAFGSSKAQENVSSSSTDIRHSVYGIDAALERKIEILDYQYFDSIGHIIPNSPMNFFIGDIKKDTIAEIILGFIIEGTNSKDVQYSLGNVSNVSATIYPETVPSCNLVVTLTIDTHKTTPSSDIEIPLELTINGFRLKCGLFYTVIE